MDSAECEWVVDKVPVPAGIAVLCPSIVATAPPHCDPWRLGPSNRQPVTGTLRFLYKESIRQAGKRLASTLGDRSYMGEKPAVFFTRCYDLRSALAHGDYPRPHGPR